MIDDRGPRSKRDEFPVYCEDSMKQNPPVEYPKFMSSRIRQKDMADKQGLSWI